MRSYQSFGPIRFREAMILGEGNDRSARFGNRRSLGISQDPDLTDFDEFVTVKWLQI